MATQFTDSVSTDQLSDEGMINGNQIGVPIYIGNDILLRWRREVDLTDEDYEIIDEYFKNLKE